MTCESAIHSSVPAPGDDPIDWSHLERTCFGDRALMRDVLGLFTTQAGQLADSISHLPADAAVSAHTLKGSALAIGAWSVAEAAERLEASLQAGSGAAAKSAKVLALRLDETCRAIAQTLSQDG